jgi:1-acyl-sn-glycerol-3-phosphate acyltransferase
VRPNPLPLSVRLCSNVLLGPPFILSTAFFGCLALLASLFDSHGRLQHSIARVWARACIFWSASRFEVLGLENIQMYLGSDHPGSSHHGRKIAHAEGAKHDVHPDAQSAVFAANHTSYMDTPVVFASLPFQFRILAKKELWSLPFIGWYLDRSGQIPIDTANPRTTLSSFAAGVRTLRQGLSVFVFPEGGRTSTGELQPFLNGAAFLAIRAQVPLVPIALVGVYDLLPMHTRHFYHPPGGDPLKLIFGEPIPTTGRSLRDSEALTEQLRQAISALIQQHSPNS